jgi:hypothetical protein
MFQLTENEYEILRSQIATSRWGGRRYLPFVFTEHGAIQAANVLASAQAVEMGIYVVRDFVQMRKALSDGMNERLGMMQYRSLSRGANDHQLGCG